MIIVSIDGIIGVGKTVFADALVATLKKQGFVPIFVPENVNEWEANGTLEASYAQKLSPAYFQTIVCADKQRLLKQALHEIRKQFGADPISDNVVLIAERLHSDSFFMDANRQMDLVTDLEMQHYKHWHNLWSSSNESLQADTIVHLKCPLSLCKERIRQRSRSGESLIDDNLQTALSDVHDAQLGQSRFHHVQGPAIQVIPISTEIDYREDDELTEQVVQPVVTFIHERMNHRYENVSLRTDIMLAVCYVSAAFLIAVVPSFCSF